MMMRTTLMFFGFCIVLMSCKNEKTIDKAQSSRDATLKVSDKFVEIKTAKLSSGKLLRLDDFSSKYIKIRPIDVWLPETYSEEKKYAVLYMHDGQMLFDSTTTWNKQEWKVDEWASTLMKARKTKDFIVVAIHNISEIRTNDFLPKKPIVDIQVQVQEHLNSLNYDFDLNELYSDDYLRFLVEELKPVIDAEFSVLTDVDNTVIMGSSMGGLISMYAISEYPDIFGAAACLSTHWIGTYTNINNPIPNAFFDYMRANLPDSKTHRLYFDYGTETLDEKYLIYQNTVSELLEEKGYNINKKFEGTDHSENSWNQRLDQPLTFLLGN